MTVNRGALGGLGELMRALYKLICPFLFGPWWSESRLFLRVEIFEGFQADGLYKGLWSTWTAK